jgi:uncharacterized protein YabN with tetrapyrrole methylase and pyrophosphatase domain
VKPGSGGSLTIVGTGMQVGVHLTPAARAAIRRADEVLYLVPDPVSSQWLQGLHSRTRSLEGLYETEGTRSKTYEAMVEQILSSVRAGLNVCAVFYGHPGVFVDPSHEAIHRARREGFVAKMHPAISTADCLFADLGLDPGTTGCLSYEATSFVLHRQLVEPSAILVLWQIGVFGGLPWLPPGDLPGLSLLSEYLARFYPENHETIVYEASPYVVCEPNIQRVPLVELADAEVPPLATLVVPPSVRPHLDLTMLDRLGLPRP